MERAETPGWKALAIAAALLAAVVAGPACEGRLAHRWPEAPWGDLRSYVGAQNMYRRTDYDGDGVFEYAFPFTVLNTQLDSKGSPVRLIDDGFADASRDTPPRGTTTPKAGYLFVDIVRGAAEGAYYDGGGSFVHGCGLCAYPAVYGRTGRWTLVIDAEGTVYAKDTGGVPVTLFPDVEKEGWEAIGG